ncbi:MAG TPA: hypothetical protein DEO56_03175 [Nitrosomonas nitrosa]|nr:hypothetical protein [Nitrosomonas nitrosa]
MIPFDGLDLLRSHGRYAIFVLMLPMQMHHVRDSCGVGGRTEVILCNLNSIEMQSIKYTKKIIIV